jgi:UDP-N-acetylmuramate-alanine ligase
MKTSLAILVGKLAIIGCKLLAFTKKGAGSVTPGHLANKIKPDLLEQLHYPRIIVAVTGSSGKGSTTAMINHILTVNNYKVAYNKSGSNLKAGATTAILAKTGIFSKKVKADVLLLECDESYIDQIFPKTKPTHLVITNITRDQPARNGTPYVIYDKILKQIDKSTTLVLNVDDPIVNRFKYDTECNVVSYGIIFFI